MQDGQGTLLDFARQRSGMIEQQIRPNAVTDRRLLAAMGEVPREMFVPSSRRLLAYSDEALEVLPAIEGAPPRFLLAPMVLAKLVQLAGVEATDRVLDVGCATGYSTALLAALSDSVIGLESDPTLVASSRDTLAALGIGNAEIVVGDLAAGYSEGGLYDVIFLNGSVPDEPTGLTAQLKEGGRLAAVVATGRAGARQGKACLFVKIDGEMSGLPHFDAGAPPLPGFAPVPRFVF